MIRHMKGAIGAAVLAAMPVTASDGCMLPKEQVADQVRYVQTHLNVAALVCRGSRYHQIPVLYNRFILKNRPHLIAGRPAMESFAARTEMSLDTYLTRSFNRVSLESTRTEGFCDSALSALRQAVGSPDPLDMLPLLPVAYVAPARSCGYAGRTAKWMGAESAGRNRE